MQIQQILIKLFCVFFSLNLIGQTDSKLLQQTQVQLNSFIADTILPNQQRIDSVAVYTHQLAEIHRKEDDLEAWAQTFFDVAYKDVKVFFSYYDTILIKKWREPKDSTEAKIFLQTCYYGSYFNQKYGDIYGVLPFGEYGEQLYNHFPLADFDIDGNIRTNLANCYTRLGQLERAVLTHKNILHNSTTSHEKHASACYNLSVSLFSQGNVEEAITQVKAGLKHGKISSCRKGILYIALSKYHKHLGKYDDALSYASSAKEALEASDKTCNYQVAQWQAGAYSVYAEALLAKGNLIEAEQWLQKAIKKAKSSYETSQNREIGKMYIPLGQLYIQQNKLPASLEAFNNALNAVINDFIPVNLYSLPDSTDLFKENTIFEALTGKAIALKQLYLENKDLKALESALICHQLAHQTEQLLRQTYQVESEKIALQSDSRGREGEAMEVLFMLYQATQNSDYLTKAFQTAEQSKSTILLDAIQANFLQRDIATNDSLFIQQQELKNYIAYYERISLTTNNTDAIAAQLLQFKEELDDVNKRILTKYPNYREQINSEIKVQDVAQLLKNHNGILLEYFQSEDHLYCLVIDTDAHITFERIHLDTNLQTALVQFKQWASDRIAFQNNPAQFYELAHQLYQQLLPQRIRLAIEQNALLKLTIIPDGILNTCPFDALLTQDHTEGGIPFLLRKAQIDYAFSTNTLLYQQALSSKAKRAMLSIIPVFAEGERGQDYLKYSESTAKQLNYAESKELLKTQATLENFLHQFQDFRILHFSTHAQADANALTPSIEFIDSTLLLPEIYNLAIPADLVVLSACETALGDARSGEGLMSIARAFAYSGSPSLVATFWKVNNESTSQLVTAFFEHLAKGKSKSEALHLAKVGYLDSSVLSRQSPYYWSGMVFIGANGMLELEPSFAWRWLLLGIIPFIVLMAWRTFKQ